MTLEKPELKVLVSEKLKDLHRRWDELETTTQAKARSLFDANRAELFAQSCSALESWLESLQAQLHSDDYGKDLTSVNILLKKQQVCKGPLGRVSSRRMEEGAWYMTSFRISNRFLAYLFCFSRQNFSVAWNLSWN